MKIKALVVLLLSATLIVGDGCTTVVQVPEGPAPGVRVRDPNAPQARIRMNNVVIVDKRLQYWDSNRVEFQPEWLSLFSNGKSENSRYSKIAVERTDARRSQTGTVEVWVTFRNRTDYTLAIQCRAHFFDGEEIHIEGPTAWQRVELPQQSIGTYREYSTEIETVKYYYIEVREAR